MSLSFRLVEGLPERASLSTDVRPPMNWLNHSLICVIPMASSLKTRWIFRMVSTWLSPSFWQNLMQYRCSSHSVIFTENNNAMRAVYTLSLTRWLHATDAICWREKSPLMCTKVPSNSLPQHTYCASLVSAEKNHVGYLIEQAAYTLQTFKWQDGRAGGQASRPTCPRLQLLTMWCSCSLAESFECSEGTCCLHLQSRSLKYWYI